jgi:hypothetical protein
MAIGDGIRRNGVTGGCCDRMQQRRAKSCAISKLPSVGLRNGDYCCIRSQGSPVTSLVGFAYEDTMGWQS